MAASHLEPPSRKFDPRQVPLSSAPFTLPQIQRLPSECPICWDCAGYGVGIGVTTGHLGMAVRSSGSRSISHGPQLIVLCWDHHSLPKSRADINFLQCTGGFVPKRLFSGSAHAVEGPSSQGTYPGTSWSESSPQNCRQGRQPWSLCRCVLSSVRGQSEEPECLGWHSVPLRGAPHLPIAENTVYLGTNDQLGFRGQSFGQRSAPTPQEA